MLNEDPTVVGHPHCKSKTLCVAKTVQCTNKTFRLSRMTLDLNKKIRQTG